MTMLQNPKKPLFIIQLFELNSWQLKTVAKSYDSEKLEKFLMGELVKTKDQASFKQDGPLAKFVPPVQSMGKVGIICLGSYEEHIERHKAEWNRIVNSAVDIDVLTSEHKTGVSNLRSISTSEKT